MARRGLCARVFGGAGFDCDAVDAALSHVVFGSGLDPFSQKRGTSPLSTLALKQTSGLK